MPREFVVNFAVAGLQPGVTVSEDELPGCNVDALVQGGFLTETGAVMPAPISDPDPIDLTAADPPLDNPPPGG